MKSAKIVSGVVTLTSASALVLSLSSCGGGVAGAGLIETCIATSDQQIDADEPYALEDASASAAGLHVATADEALAPPAQFTACAADLSVNLDLVDDDGRHVWLALDAELDGADLLDGALFSGLRNASVEATRSRSWDVFDAVEIVVDNTLVFALHRSTDSTRGIEVVAEDAGLPAFETCGTVTPQRLRFNDRLVLEQGSSGPLEIADGTYTAFNLGSVRYANRSCDDAIEGTVATWLVRPAAIP